MLSKTIQLYRNSFADLSREVWLLSAVMLINRSGMMVIPFLSIYLTGQLDFSLWQTGFIIASFGAGSFVGTLLGGYLTDRIGYYPIQFWSLLITGLMFGVLMLMKTFWAFSICIFILTTIADTFRPANFAAIRVYSKPENRTRSISLVRLAINLGIGIGPAIGGFVAGRYGYEWLFLGDGLTCIAAAIFFRFMLKKRKSIKEEKEEHKKMVKFNPFSDKLFLLFLLSTLFVAVAFIQILSTTPLAFKEIYGMSEFGIGLLFAINGFLIFLLEMPIVYLLERRFNTMWLIALGSFIVGLSYFVIVLPTSWVGIALASIVLITFGEIISFPFSSGFAVQRAPEGMVGRFMGLYSLVFSVGLILAPILGMNMIQNFGYTALYWLLGGLCMSGAVGYLILGRLMTRQPKISHIEDVTESEKEGSQVLT